jgi:hypothetical protein
MRRSHSLIVAAALSAACSSVSLAQIVVDGSRDAGYGTPLAVQTTGTQFGDSVAGDPAFAFGSELNAAYGRIENGQLYLLLTGNLETNFNKLEIFFDVREGGQNQLRGDNPDVDFNGLNRMGADGSNPGLKFDADFAADFFLTVTAGNNPIEIFSNAADVLTSGGGNGFFIGTGGPGNTIINSSFDITVALNNSNAAGVGSFGSPDVSDPASVETGVEVRIPLSFLGDPTADIKVNAFINGGGHDFMSNQVLGSAPITQGNFGEPRLVDFSLVDGNQYFTIANAPAVPNQWGTLTAGNWSQASNWTQSLSPNGAGANARLLAGPSSSTEVTLDVPVTLNRLDLGGPGYTLSGAGPLTFAGVTFDAIQVEAGEHTIAVPVVLQKDVRVTIPDGSNLNVTGSISGASNNLFKAGAGGLSIPASQLNSVTVNGGLLSVTSPTEAAGNLRLRGLTVDAGAELDLTDTVLLVDYDDGFSPLERLLDYGGDGRLTGAGTAIGSIDSAQAGLTSFNGVDIDATTLVLRATDKGDTNLDLAVDFSDLLTLAQNYDDAFDPIANPPKVWALGDFDRDGVVGFSDLLALAQNYDSGSVVLGSGFSAEFTTAWTHAMSVVPEPATLGLLAGVGVLALRRRA